MTFIFTPVIMVDLKYRRTHRSKSLPSNQSSKKSFFSIFSRRLSLSSKRQSNSVRLYDDSDDDDTAQVIPQQVEPPDPLSSTLFSYITIGRATNPVSLLPSSLSLLVRFIGESIRK